MKKKILFLASGGGGTMKFVHLASIHAEMPYEVIGAIADRECGSIDYCRSNNLLFKVIKPWRDNTKVIVELIKQLSPDIVVTNISKILPVEIFNCCHATFINLHYSLLPSFGGVIGFKTLELAKEHNSRIIGATCHFVNEEVDAGRILSQGAMTVDWNKDLMDIIEKNTFRIACKTILSAIIELCDQAKPYPSNDGFLYSPALNFDDSFITEELWACTR